MQPAPVFGKRAPPPRPALRPPATPVERHDVATDAAGIETAETGRTLVVPRSLRAAMLAGLVVGCGLAGLDATHADTTLLALSGGLVSAAQAPRLVPVVIAIGLYGGARAAAESLVVAHALLRRVGATSHLAYVLGGGLTALALALVTARLARTGVLNGGFPPPHGLALDTASGALAGLLYRIFAGARSAKP